MAYIGTDVASFNESTKVNWKILFKNNASSSRLGFGKVVGLKVGMEPGAFVDLMVQYTSATPLTLGGASDGYIHNISYESMPSLAKFVGVTDTPGLLEDVSGAIPLIVTGSCVKQLNSFGLIRRDSFELPGMLGGTSEGKAVISEAAKLFINSYIGMKNGAEPDTIELASQARMF